MKCHCPLTQFAFLHAATYWPCLSEVRTTRLTSTFLNQNAPVLQGEPCPLPTHILGLRVKYLSFPPNILIRSQRRFPWCVPPSPPAPHGRLLTILNARDSLLLSPDERNTPGKPEVLESEGLHNQPQQRWKVHQLLCPQLGPLPEGGLHFPLDPL